MKSRLTLLAAVVLVLSLTANAQVIDPALHARLGSILSSEPLRVVVTFHNAPGLLDRALLTTLTSRAQFLDELPIALVELPASSVTRLLGRANIRSLYLDRELQYFLHESTARIGAPAARTDFGVDGSGIGVAVIDSGVDGTHQDLSFGSKVVQNAKIVGTVGLTTNVVQAVENLPNSDTSSGHGTHCAGAVAGTGAASGGHHAGVAPGAHILGVGTGDAIFVFHALEGFDYVLANKDEYNIRVISNSW